MGNCQSDCARNSSRDCSKAVDADIAGPGVTSSYAASAAIVLMLTVAVSYMRWASGTLGQHMLQKKLQGIPWCELDNTHAQMLHDLSQLTGSYHRWGERTGLASWTLALEHLVLGLSDQQLLTGLLILTLGYAQYCTISWSSLLAIIHQAFFSGITHAASLTVLREDMRKNRKMRTLRLILIFMILGLWLSLSILLRPVIGLTSKQSICSFYCLLHLGSGMLDDIQHDQNLSDQNFQTALLVLLFWSYWAVCWPIFVSDAGLAAREAFGGFMEGAIDFLSHFKLLKARKVPRTSDALRLGYLELWYDSLIENRPAIYPSDSVFAKIRKSYTRLATWLSLTACRVGCWFVKSSQARNLLRSFSAAILYLLLETILPWDLLNGALVFLWAVGIFQMVSDGEFSGPNNSWGFGQLLPLLLVILPFMTLFESYEEVIDGKKKRHTPATDQEQDAEMVVA